MWRLLALLLLVSGLLAGCGATKPGPQATGKPTDETVTVYKSPT